MEGKRSFPCTTVWKSCLLLLCAHQPTPADRTGRSPARQFTKMPWPRRRLANSRHFPAMQLYSWPESNVPLPLAIRSASSEESPHLPSPHCTFLPAHSTAQSPQTDTDVGSPSSKLKAVVAQRRPQAGNDGSGGGLSHCCNRTAPSHQSRPVCPRAAVSAPSLPHRPFLLAHTCSVQILFSCRSPTVYGWVSPEICLPKDASLSEGKVAWLLLPLQKQHRYNQRVVCCLHEPLHIRGSGSHFFPDNWNLLMQEW